LGETFGRVTIEAMAFGLPVCLPNCFPWSCNHILWWFYPSKYCWL